MLLKSLQVENKEKQAHKKKYLSPFFYFENSQIKENPVSGDLVLKLASYSDFS